MSKTRKVASTSAALAALSGATLVGGGTVSATTLTAPREAPEVLLPIDTATRPDFQAGDGSSPVYNPKDLIDSFGIGRAYFGLPSDRAFVKQLVQKVPKAGGSVSDDGTVDWSRAYPLLVTELPVVERHEAIDRTLRTLGASGSLAKAVGPGYAGVWVDHAAGGRVTVASTTAVNIDAVRSLFPAGTDVELRLAEYSLAELVQLRDQLTETWIANGQQLDGEPVQGIGINEVLNSINLFLPHLDRQRGDALKVALQRRLASSPVVFRSSSKRRLPVRLKYGEPVAGEPVNSRSADPKQGGQRIQLGNADCTTGFWARTRDTHESGIVTAGHCKDLIYGDDVGWAAPAPSFGHYGKQTWSIYTDGFLHNEDGSIDADQMFVRTDTSVPNNWVYLENGKSLPMIGIYVPAAFGYNPWPACGVSMFISLGRSDSYIPNVLQSCDDIDITRSGNNMPVERHTTDVHVCVIPGDSGSPLFHAEGGAGLGAGILSWRSVNPANNGCSWPEPNAFFSSFYYGLNKLQLDVG